MRHESGFGIPVRSLVNRRKRRNAILSCYDPREIIEEVRFAVIGPAKANIRTKWADTVERHVTLGIFTVQIAEITVWR